MNNINNLTSCKECSTLLKKKDTNERGLCPKCLTKNVDIQIVEVLEVQSKEIDIDECEMSSNILEVLIENQSMPELIKVEIPTLKPGQAVREKFMELVSRGLITEEYIFELSTKEGTAQCFGIRYPFLLEYDGNKPIKEQAYVNGHSRYTSKPFTINERQYLITNDIYAKTVPKFMEWSNSLNK